LGLWAILLVGIFAWAPALYPGYWQASEGFRPVFNIGQSAVIAGVTTDPDLWRGTGRTTFLAAQPLLALGLSATAAVRMLFVAAVLLGGLGIYVWMRVRFNDHTAGLAGLLYMLWPPLLSTVYVRGSVADAWVLGLLPLALAGLAVFVANRSPSSAGVAVLALLWMWRTQAGLALFATLLLIAYALIVERSRTAALVAAVTGLAGLTSLIPYWNVRALPPVPFAEHFIYPFQLLYNGPSGLSESQAGGEPLFYPGFAILAFGIVAIWLWRTGEPRVRNRVPPRFVPFALSLTLISVLLALPFSRPLWLWSGGDQLLTYPWQLLLLIGPFLAAVGGLLPTLQERLAETALWSVLIALVALSSFPFLQPLYTQVSPPLTPVAAFGSRHEIVVLDMRLQEDAQANTAELNVTWQPLSKPDFDYNVFFQALAADSESVLGQLDTQPLQGERPATTWEPGEIFTDTYRIDLSTAQAESGGAATPGRDHLRYYFGYYDWRDGTRLPLSSGIDDKLVLYGE
jgi:hypothetical protein